MPNYQCGQCSKSVWSPGLCAECEGHRRMMADYAADTSAASQHLAEIEYEREERRERKEKRKKKAQIARHIERQLKGLEHLATDLEDEECHPPSSINDWIKLLGQIAVMCRISREAWCDYATQHPHLADTIYLRLHSSATSPLGILQQQSVQLPDAAIEIVHAIEKTTTYQNIRQMKDAILKEEESAARAKAAKQLEAAEREKAALNNPRGCPNCGSDLFTYLGRSGPPKWLEERSCGNCSTRYAPPQVTVANATGAGCLLLAASPFLVAAIASIDFSGAISLIFFCVWAIALVKAIMSLYQSRSVRL